ncbi:MAG: RsmB/NOP family class I SAM-dependent RNA methyltransferase [Verrucomicrobia bacterium]|nr:RsmB/NOP family class I SAM-dependent RNA methyltransferase [Verrucomicrobiota bacterium]
MRQTFCDYHISTFLARREANPGKPLDLALSEYLREHKSIGAHDRRQIGETLFGLARWKSLLDHLCPPGISIPRRLEIFKQINWRKIESDSSIPESLKLGATPFLFEKLSKYYGPEKAKELLLASLTPAPIAIRANALKTSREDLLARWQGKFDAIPSPNTPYGILFSKREPLFALAEFKEGLFEMQDEGSQLVASLVEAKSGNQILDYCSGSGGKTLAFAPAMSGKGQIYLHDIRPQALAQAKQRLKRAGIQNVQFLSPDHPKLPQLKNKMDWVLADVPCSGTGTFRRNPEMKWKIDQAMIDRLVLEQRQIFEEALSYVRPGGRIVYATCSILPEENQEQVAHFGLTLEREPLSILPAEGKMDGFFAAVFKKSEMVSK